MPNLNTAQFTLTDMTTKRSLGERLQELPWITVKDFGAVGDGDHDDTENIQAALDFAYGPREAPHGSSNLANDLWGPGMYTFHTGELKHTNKIVYFPAGNYKITYPLEIYVGHGVNLIGAGSHQTRIFWSGPELLDADLDLEHFYLPYSTMLFFYMCWHTRIEGMTIDASNTQAVGLRLYPWPDQIDFTVWDNSTAYVEAEIARDPDDGSFWALGFGHTSPGSGTFAAYRAANPSHWFEYGHYGGYAGDDGSGGHYEDVHFANCTSSGFMSVGAEMGSERVFWFCRFSNCGFAGHRLLFQNALNHSFYFCEFDNNYEACRHTAAGQCTFDSCIFTNSTVRDLWVEYGPSRIVNCVSTSVNFAASDGVFIANRHVNATEGVWNTYQGGTGGTIYIANYSLNSKQAANGVEKRATANNFVNAAFWTAFIGVGGHAFIDDTEYGSPSW